MVTLVVTVLTLPHIRSYGCYRKLQGRQRSHGNNRSGRIGHFIGIKIRFIVFFRLSPVRLPCAAVLVMATGSLLKRPKTRFTPK
jgi:hypothetical protein